MKLIKLPLQIKNLLSKFKLLGKHHYFIFITLLLCGLVLAVYVVNQTLSAPIDEVYRAQKLSESLNISFDQTTVKKIEDLQKSSEGGVVPPVPVAGVRTNPFAE